MFTYEPGNFKHLKRVSFRLLNAFLTAQLTIGAKSTLQTEITKNPLP